MSSCKDCVHYEVCKYMCYNEDVPFADPNRCINFHHQSRYVELPCEVGQTVYSIRWWDDAKEKCTDSKGKTFYRKTIKHKVTKEKFDPFSLDYKQFGEIVFLSREEAEMALSERSE